MMDTFNKQRRFAALISVDGKRHYIHQDKNTIGRSPNALICIEDQSISRKHCVIERVGHNSFTICDMSSSGTSLNDAVLIKDQPYPLYHHDCITLANSEKYSYKFVINRRFNGSPSQKSVLSPEMKIQVVNLDTTQFEEMKKMNADISQIEVEKVKVETVMREKLEAQEKQFREEQLSLKSLMISATRDKEELEKKLKDVEEKSIAEKEKLLREREKTFSDMVKREEVLQNLKIEMELRHRNEHKELQDRFKAETDELKKKLAEYEVKCKQQENQNKQTQELQTRLEEQEKQIVKLEETKRKMIDCEIEQFRIFEEKLQVEEDLGSKIIDLTNESYNKDEIVKTLEKKLQEKEEDEIMRKRGMEDLEEELQCSICTELFIEPTILNCGHMFCKTCIDEWKKKKKECPVCRNKISTSLRFFTVDNIIDKNVALLPEEARSRRKMLITNRQEARCAVPAKKKKNKHLPGNRSTPHPNASLPNSDSGPIVLNDSLVYIGPINLDQRDPFSWNAHTTRSRNRSDRQVTLNNTLMRPADGRVSVAAIDLTNINQSLPATARPSTSTGVMSTIDLTNP